MKNAPVNAVEVRQMGKNSAVHVREREREIAREKCEKRNLT